MPSGKEDVQPLRAAGRLSAFGARREGKDRRMWLRLGGNADRHHGGTSGYGGLPDELTYPLLTHIRSSLSRLVNLGVEKPILRSGLPIAATMTILLGATCTPA